MSTPLLKTKLFIPRPRPNLVPRPDLIARLNAGLRGKLTVVSAPAGFGKTTLLSEWIHQIEQGEKIGREKFFPSNAAWLSLDEGDNDLARFLAYLIASLRTIPELQNSNTGETLLQAFQSPSVGKEDSQTTTSLLTELINEITVHGPISFYPGTGRLPPDRFTKDPRCPDFPGGKPAPKYAPGDRSAR